MLTDPLFLTIAIIVGLVLLPLWLRAVWRALSRLLELHRPKAFVPARPQLPDDREPWFLLVLVPELLAVSDPPRSQPDRT